MNKTHRIIGLIAAIFLITACSEKQQYAEAVLTEMQTEPDIKDYKLDPEKMADCVVNGTSKKMPGLFPADPIRKKSYISYTKMLTIKKSKDPQKTMDELRVEFGSAQGLLAARNNYTDNLVECQTTFISNVEPVDSAAPKK